MTRQTRRSRAGRSLAGRAIGAVLGALGSILASFVLSPPLVAQVRQYTPPGGAVDEATGRKEGLEKAVEAARWHAGPLRLDPAFWISDLAWVDRPASGASGSGSDLTGRVGAGLRGYLPVGPKTTLAAYALPEYVWWQKNAEARRVNQRFGVGSFTFFNRLVIALTAKRDEDFGFATGEILQRYTARNEELALDLEVPIVRRLSLYAKGVDLKVTSLADSSTSPGLAAFFAGLDRQDRGYRGGIRYRPNARLRLGAGAGHAESAFAPGALDRSNSGDLWYVEAGYERPKLVFDVMYEQNRLQATDGSGFSDFNGSTGSGRLEWRPRETFSARLYGGRALAYSLLVEAASAYVDESVGIGMNVGLGWRLRLGAYAETGSHRYRAGAGAPSPGPAGGASRVDDVASYGIDLKIELMRRLNLRVGYQESKVSPPSGSGLPGQKISQVLVNLGFGFNQGTWY